MAPITQITIFDVDPAKSREKFLQFESILDHFPWGRGTETPGMQRTLYGIAVQDPSKLYWLTGEFF